MPPPRSKIKLDISKRPDIDPGFANLNISKQKYVWANWNNMRAKANMAAVQFPVVGESTHRPWGGVTANPNVTVEPHLRHPPGNANQPRITEFSTQFPANEFNDQELTDLLNNPKFNKWLKSVESTGAKPGSALEEDKGSEMSKRPRIDDAEAGNTASVSGNNAEAASMDVGDAGAAGAIDNTASSGSGFSGALANQSGKHVFVPRPMSFKNSNILKFNKVHKMLSYGLEFSQIVSGNELFMTTSLLEVPWDRLFFYMSKSEYESLPQGAHALSAEISITQRNTRVSFEVGGTEAGAATLNQNKFGLKALNIPAKCVGTNYQYTYDVSNNMTPTGAIEKQYVGWTDKLYGLLPSQAGFNTSQPYHTLGIPYHFNSYFTLRTFNEQFAIANPDVRYVGWPNYSEYIQEYDMNAEIGNTIHSQKYVFASAPIKQPIVDGWPLGQSNSYADSTSRNHMIDTLYNPSEISSSGIWQNKVLESVNTTVQMTFNEDQLIERSTQLNKGKHNFPSRRQPSIHIGVKPVPKLTTVQEFATQFTDVESWFEVAVTLIVKIDMPCEYPAFTGDNSDATQILRGLTVRPEDAITQNFTAQNVNQPLLYGQYPVTG